MALSLQLAGQSVRNRDPPQDGLEEPFVYNLQFTRRHNSSDQYAKCCAVQFAGLAEAAVEASLKLLIVNSLFLASPHPEAPRGVPVLAVQVHLLGLGAIAFAFCRIV